ncbi:hypothetical protein ABEB36_007763 [Hypothenemus hampei]|uniref:DNA polymerase eta n=1 Tax=Hypothenemus hampei TaxID=57062 RepID=A0ABD1EY55_HYPHA
MCTNRIIVLIDMDCFYCQVEENLNANWKGKPLAVVQYNQWRGGGIIAVNYPARDQGVTRHMRGDEARKKCPDIILAKVPQVRGKADISKYRDAGKKVADVLVTFTQQLERASVDEAYLDITNIVDKRIQEGNDIITRAQLPNTLVVGSTTEGFIENVTQNRTFDEYNFKLALGGVIAEEIRRKVLEVTGYKCSAGIAHNKILAKLVCGLHKPNKQTILPQEAVPQLYAEIPLKKVQGLGGKFGNKIMQRLGVKFMGEVTKFSQNELGKIFDEKSASWLYNIARGIDNEPVNARLVSKSIGSCKQFAGRAALCEKQEIEHWLNELAEDICERLTKDMKENNRKAHQIVVNFGQDDEVHSSKSYPMNSYDKGRIVSNGLKIIEKYCAKSDGTYRITFLGLSAGNFQEFKKGNEITSFFKNMQNNAINRKSIENVSALTNAENIADDNDSIYSRTTEEDSSIDTDSLIFYENINPESVTRDNCLNTAAAESIMNEVNCDISRDSIREEINTYEGISPMQTDEFENNEKPQESFFIKYFSTHFKSDLDTLKSNSDCEDTNCNDKSLDSDCSIQCSYCEKTIVSSEYQTHLDYHFALNLVKNESEPIMNPRAQSSRKKPVSPKKVSKKKVKDQSQKPLDAFFKNIRVIQDESSEVCKECHKAVPISELDIHKDYHLAKKLHFEINEKQQSKGVKRKLHEPKGILGFLQSSTTL